MRVLLKGRFPQLAKHKNVTTWGLLELMNISPTPIQRDIALFSPPSKSIALCPTTVDLTTQTTVETAADDEAKAAKALVKTALGDAYSETGANATKYVVVPKYEVKGQQTFASTVTAADVKTAVATTAGIAEALVQVTVTASRRRLLAGSTADFTITSTSRATANTIRATTASTPVTVGGVSGTVVPAASKIAATYVVNIDVPQESAATVKQTLDAADFESSVNTAVGAQVSAMTVQSGSTTTITDLEAEIKSLKEQLGELTSGVDRRAGVVVSAVLGVVAAALLQ